MHYFILPEKLKGVWGSYNSASTELVSGAKVDEHLKAVYLDKGSVRFCN